MTSPEVPRCARNHVLSRYEVLMCFRHGEHRIYRCPMRRGNARCDAPPVVEPELTGGCDMEDRDRG